MTGGNDYVVNRNCFKYQMLCSICWFILCFNHLVNHIFFYATLCIYKWCTVRTTVFYCLPLSSSTEAAVSWSTLVRVVLTIIDPYSHFCNLEQKNIFIKRQLNIFTRLKKKIKKMNETTCNTWKFSGKYKTSFASSGN